MPGISLKVIGDYAKTWAFLHRVENPQLVLQVLHDCGRLGVEALASATPTDTGETANSWSYEVEVNGKTSTIVWKNSNLAKGYFPVAIMLQYGHGTGTGGYVQGIDYINPAIAPVFDQIANTVWKAVCDS